MLKVAIGKAIQYEDSIQAAVEQYNEVDGRKTFHHKESRYETIYATGDIADITWITEIWFTVQELEQSKPVNQFIGSVGIDPNDPDWRTKLQAQNDQEGTQEGSRATIDSEWYSGIGVIKSEP